ncbi:hypothetical protein OG426_31665 [Streptomyces canus]|uniref:hypothetical protein n=1 Tax=Streptomyces canus TaxID=58343 RepID=UPI00225610AD|nr:hypothetical protein [Streptomyces canus]MCX4857997.1 hypothetical protein [Streptomyces canus]WSW36680.1 hypothetical protein OG426_31665 [Streptomyces canus]
MRVLAVWGAVVAVGVVLGGGTAVAAAGPEADLAYHGAASMAGGRVDVRFTPRNHGPAAVPDATVRLRWSEPLVDGQTFPEGCARSAARAVLCRLGALAADGVGKRVEMWVRLRGVPSEVLLEIDTVWNGGTVDRNRENDRQRVLVLDSGDAYHF